MDAFPTFRHLSRNAFPTFGRLWRSAWPWYTTPAQSQALLRLIAVATEENLPLGPIVASWAQDERGVQSQRLARLAGLLNADMPLSSALEAVPRALREEDLLAIRFDAKMGTRTAAMRSNLISAQASQGVALPGVQQTLVYFAAVMPVGLLIVWFTHLKIVPVLHRILQDFELAEPQVLRLSQHLTDLLRSGIPPLILLLLAVLWLAFSTQPGRLLRRAVLSRLRAPHSELLAADVLQKLAIATSAGRPLAGALSALARYHFDPLLRNKLLFVRNELEQGADVWQSLAAVELLATPEVRLLEIAERADNRPWTLRQLADVRKGRALRRWEYWSLLLLPGLVLAMGLIVLFQALIVFLPLTKLIHSL